MVSYFVQTLPVIPSPGSFSLGVEKCRWAYLRHRKVCESDDGPQLFLSGSGA